MPPIQTNLLQGTLDLLILKSLALGELHGLGVSRRIDQITKGTFSVGPGSLFPALHRMEQEGWLSASWRITEKGRKAKYYAITEPGTRQLALEQDSWLKLTRGVAPWERVFKTVAASFAAALAVSTASRSTGSSRLGSISLRYPNAVAM